jgi:hypothetical protein
MSIVANAMRDLMALGVEGEALIAAVDRIVEAIQEQGARDLHAALACATAKADAQLEARKASARNRQAKYDAKRRQVTSDDASANPRKEKSPTPPKETQPLPPSPPTGAHGSAPKAKTDEVRDAVEAWNDLARRCKLPVAKTLDASRRKSVAARLAEGGPDGWDEALAGVERSAFCRGLRLDKGGRSFRADLDFVCQPQSFRRLREGFYGDDAKPLRPAPIALTPELHAQHLRHYADTGEWREAWGPRPAEVGPVVPFPRAEERRA